MLSFNCERSTNALLLPPTVVSNCLNDPKLYRHATFVRVTSKLNFEQLDQLVDNIEEICVDLKKRFARSQRKIDTAFSRCGFIGTIWAESYLLILHFPPENLSHRQIRSQIMATSSFVLGNFLNLAWLGFSLSSVSPKSEIALQSVYDCAKGMKLAISELRIFSSDAAPAA